MQATSTKECFVVLKESRNQIGTSCQELKGHCHATWQLHKKLEGVFEMEMD